MKFEKCLADWFRNAREKSRTWLMVLYIFLGITVALTVFIGPHEPHFVYDYLPGFFGAFGLVATIILGRVSKGTAHTFLGKDEDYYERD